MQKKLLILFIGGISVLAALGVYILLHDSGADEMEYASEDLPPPPLQDDSPSDGIRIPESTRESVAPAEAFVEEPSDTMPASYRAALGGIKGRVVEEDGSPVVEIPVELFGMSALDIFFDAEAFMGEEPPELAFKTGRTLTSEEGDFFLADVYPRAIYVLGIDLGGMRSTTRFIDHIPGTGEIVDLGDIVLAPHAVILGRVVDEESNPVGGARIRAIELPAIVFLSGLQDFREGCSFLARMGEENRVFDLPPAARQFFHLMPFPTTQSDSDGTFRLEGVPLGFLSLVVDRVDYVTNHNTAVNTSRGGEKNVGDVMLDAGVLLKGKVLDFEGEPASGIEVRVGPMHGVAEMIVLQPPIRTDKEGEFTFPGAAPRSFFAAARRHPEDPWVVTGPFHPELEPPVITLPPAYDLRLVVMREDGFPAKGARVMIREEHPFGDFLLIDPPKVPKTRMKTPEEGIIEIQDLPSGSYELLVSAPECGVTKEVVTIKDEPLGKQIVLERAYTAEVRVLTEKMRVPVEWAEVYAVPGEEAWMLKPTELSRGRTNAEGLAVLKNLAPGDYHVTASHPQYAVTSGTLEVPSDGDVIVTVKPGGTIEGVVLQGASEYEGPYMVAMTLDEWSGNPEAQTPRITVTDLEGKFKATNLYTGVWEVHVMKRLLDQDPLGLGEVMRRGPLMSQDVEVWSEETSYVEFLLGSKDFGPSGKVAGKVMLDGAPAAGAMIGLWAKRRFEDTVDSSGNYDLGRVPVGKHSIRISQLPGPAGKYDFNIRRGIEVEEDLPLYEVFEIYTGAISGRVINEGDRSPVRGSRVTARIEEAGAPYSVRMSTVTGLDGSFDFEGVPIGVYSVKAAEREFASRSASGVKVFPGNVAGPVIISLITPILVQGRVTLPDEAKEARWVGLLFRSEEGQGAEWAKLDKSTGNFETKKLVPGSYKAELVGDLKKKYEVMPFDVPPGGVSDLVLISKEKTDEDAQPKTKKNG